MPNAYLIDSTRAEAVTHPLTLAAMQDTVGGYIAPAFTVPSPTRPGFAVTGYVNDEGILMDLPVTLVHTESEDPLCGPVLICGLDETTGDTTPLDADELDWIKSRLRLLASMGSFSPEGGTKTRAVHGLYLTA
jgi:hypothetical protein